jgi:hypothetical protein
VSLKKYKAQGKAVEVTVNSKEENSEDFCLDFVQEFGFSMYVQYSTIVQITVLQRKVAKCHNGVYNGKV